MAKVPPSATTKNPALASGFLFLVSWQLVVASPPPSSTPTQACCQDATLFNAAAFGSVFAGVAAPLHDQVIIAMNPKVRELLGEPSTWRGIALLLTAAGIQLSPDQVAAITSVGLAVTGFIGAFCRDKGGQ